MIALILAASENGVIGNKGGLPWKLSNDLTNFKKLTNGHVIIMGRKTYESIGRPLPGRYNIVVTRDVNWKADGVHVVHDIKDAFTQAFKSNKGTSNVAAYVIGGSEIYKQALPYADSIVLTKVHAIVEGDTFIDLNMLTEFHEIFCTRNDADDKNEFAHSFIIYSRTDKSSIHPNPFDDEHNLETDLPGLP